jgi:AraC family transcriptional activator of pobA
MSTIPTNELERPQIDTPTGISQYALYGEVRSDTDPEFVHIEDIKTRSRLYEWQITPHSHQGMFQIIYVSEGGCSARMDQQTVELTGPCAITIPSGVVHGFSFDPDIIGSVVTVSDQLLIDERYRESQELFSPLLLEPRVIDFSANSAQCQLLDSILSQMKVELQWPQMGRASMFDWLLRIIMMVMRRQMAIQDTSNDAKGYQRHHFARFRLLLEEHYRSHWHAAEYANALAMSPARLKRLCLTFAGKTALQMIQERLLLEAQRHLIYTSATAAQIAYELGFQDPGYFSRFFKRHTGQAPGQFRNLQSDLSLNNPQT